MDVEAVKMQLDKITEQRAREVRRPFDDRIVSQLRRSLLGAERGLKSAPGMLRTVIEHEIWRKRVVEETGELVSFKSFEEFVQAPPLEGLGSTIRQVKNLCKDDKAALAALDRATVGEPGAPEGNQNNASGVNQYTLQDAEDSRTNGLSQPICPTTEKKRDRSGRLLRRLREQRQDLHKQVLNKDKSVAEAAIEAGFYPKRISVNLRSPESAASSIRRSASPEFIEALVKDLQRG
jgi:hypothetical protein